MEPISTNFVPNGSHESVEKIFLGMFGLKVHKIENFFDSDCAADFSLLNLPKGKSLGRGKPA